MIGQRALRERYRAFVEAGVDEEIERFYRQALTLTEIDPPVLIETDPPIF